MSTLKQFSKKECKKIMKLNGYEVIRIKGDHLIYSNGIRSISIPDGEPNKMLFRRIIKENNLILV